MASCPECEAELEIDDDYLEEMAVGDPWDCDACGVRLRVGVLDPLEFDSDDEDDADDSDDDGDDDAEEELDEDDDKDSDDWDE